jgi:hypothetical protein
MDLSRFVTTYAVESYKKTPIGSPDFSGTVAIRVVTTSVFELFLLFCQQQGCPPPRSRRAGGAHALESAA